jgi:hypothetical protein
MTITIQENTDISLKDDIKKITQIQNVPASLSSQDSNKKAKLPYKGDYVEKVLSDIIISSKGKPDRLAIMLYSFLKSWFKPNSNRKFNKSGKFDVRKYGYRTSYEQLAKELAQQFPDVECFPGNTDRDPLALFTSNLNSPTF